MTKKELKQKMLEFIQSKQDDDNNEWWCTDRELNEMVLAEFAETIGINLD